MRVARLKIRNFRGIKEAVFLLPEHGVLIGDNNTGKTTILEAMNLVLGPDRLSRQPPIDEHDFFRGEYTVKPSAAQAGGGGKGGAEAAAAGEAPATESDSGAAGVPRIEIEATVANLTEEQKGKFGDYVEFWDSTRHKFYGQPNPAGVDPAHITEAPRVTFHGWYDEE